MSGYINWFSLLSLVVVFLLLLVLALLLGWWHRRTLSENMHGIVVKILQFCPVWLIPSQIKRNKCDIKRVMGLEFRNTVGLAAGWDKQAQCINALYKMGFGFVEIGGVTPKPQLGNPRPRVFRLPSHRSIINRYGLNSDGVEVIARRLSAKRAPGLILGANIAPNTATEHEFWVDDYCYCLERLYPSVDYFTVNVSCPNTGHSDQQQTKEFLDTLMSKLSAKSRQVAAEKSLVERPILLKVGPDQSEEALRVIVDLALQHGITGIVAVNTTTKRPVDCMDSVVKERGGLSGPPLYDALVRTLRLLKHYGGDRLTLIAVGGIDSAEQVVEVRAAGADLVQILTSFVYCGPRVLKRL